MRPGDHVFAIEGSCGPAAPLQLYPLPDGVNVIRIPAVFIGLAYDLVARSSHHDQLVFIGSGGTISEGDVDEVRATLESIAPGAVVLSPHRTSSAVALGARSVIGVSRRVVLDLGGMAHSTYKARGMSAGLIGSGDLFDALVNEVRRSGWRTEHLHQASSPDQTADGVPGVRRSDHVVPMHGGIDEAVPPSWRISDELRAAAAPGAGVVVDWFAGLLSEEQRRALSGLIGREAKVSSKATAKGWDLLFFVDLLWRSGQVPYAAHVLQVADLSPFTGREQVAEIRRMLSEAGRPFAVVLEKLAHAHDQLAAGLLELPAAEANIALQAWWEVSPGNELVIRTLRGLAPRLRPTEIAAWELRIGRSLQQTSSV